VLLFYAHVQLAHLKGEANRLSADKPEEAALIRNKITELTEDWLSLKEQVSSGE